MLNLSFKTLPLLLLVILINGCATAPTPAGDAPAADAPNWHLRGKLAVIQPDERVSANLHWRHRSSSGQDDLRLSTPIGTTVLVLNSQPGRAQVRFDGQQHEGQSADQLIERLTGWPLPLSQISRYLLGDTQGAQAVQYDEFGEPSALELVHPATGEQWQLRYLGWQQLSGYKVPRQIELRRGDQRLKLALSHWQPEP
ncbi:lipoprotein insertase outer membrane protein LolB [Ferrimonas balearica]|uniref:lipoprotein insertase outer membrane protein LolB n=1 Tax=Ferrimonas balearica TaxID=44012 RepID=UPI001C99D6F6|nr:lipoprotein insertase outer membrane protein LolB [Ferrimonas balearica]MBY5992743.1 lipoprotein insertase outer membrane protein LolB [Ferrimonas balearica]